MSGGGDRPVVHVEHGVPWQWRFGCPADVQDYRGAIDMAIRLQDDQERDRWLILAEGQIMNHAMPLIRAYRGEKADRRTLAGLYVQLCQIVDRFLPPSLKHHVLVDGPLLNRDVNVALSVPQFKHDCDECRFLGRFADDRSPQPKEYDLYVCDKQLMGRTFVARFADDGPAYISGPYPGMSRATDEAMRRFDVTETR